MDILLFLIYRHFSFWFNVSKKNCKEFNWRYCHQVKKGNEALVLVIASWTMRTASAVPGLLIDKRLAVGIWWGLLVLIAGLYYTQSEYYDVLKEQMTGKTLDKYVAKTDYKDIGIGSPRLVETSSAFRGTAPTPTAPTTGEGKSCHQSNVLCLL